MQLARIFRMELLPRRLMRRGQYPGLARALTILWPPGEQTTKLWRQSFSSASQETGAPWCPTPGADRMTPEVDISTLKTALVAVQQFRTSMTRVRHGAYRHTTSRIFFRGPRFMNFLSARARGGSRVGRHPGFLATGKRTLLPRRGAARHTI